MKPYLIVSHVVFVAVAALAGAILLLSRDSAETGVPPELEARMAALEATLDRRDAIDERFDEIGKAMNRLEARVRAMRGLGPARKPKAVRSAPKNNAPTRGDNAGGIEAVADRIESVTAEAEVEIVRDRLGRLAPLANWSDEEYEAIRSAYEFEIAEVRKIVERGRASGDSRADVEARIEAARSKRVDAVRETLGADRYEKVAASLPKTPRIALPNAEED